MQDAGQRVAAIDAVVDQKPSDERNHAAMVAVIVAPFLTRLTIAWLVSDSRGGCSFQIIGFDAAELATR
jgi:hypothetical protein